MAGSPNVENLGGGRDDRPASPLGSDRHPPIGAPGPDRRLREPGQSYPDHYFASKVSRDWPAHPSARRVSGPDLVAGDYVKASLIFSPACVRLALVWSTLPAACRSGSSVALPTFSFRSELRTAGRGRRPGCLPSSVVGLGGTVQGLSKPAAVILAVPVGESTKLTKALARAEFFDALSSAIGYSVEALSCAGIGMPLTLDPAARTSVT